MASGQGLRCTHLGVFVDVPEVQPSLAIYAGKEGGVDRGPPDIVDVLVVVLK